jgi:ATP-dependent RNA helicase SUPV3L1/SUV3
MGRHEAPPDDRLREPGEGADASPEPADGPPHPDPLPASGERVDAAAPPIVEPQPATASVGVQAPETEPATITADGGGVPSPTGATAETAEPLKDAATPPPSEPLFIEVWRPGRPEGRRRPRGRHREAGKNSAKGAGEPTQEAGAPAVSAQEKQEAAAESPSEKTAPAEPSKAERHSRHRRRHGPDQRFDRPRREREQAPAHVARQERREKAPDPNSPFAKLAALKAQLEAEAKERR